MFKCIVIFLSMGLAAAVAQAQPDTGERVRTVETAPAEAATAQQRRAALREVLQSQREGRAQPATASGTGRQLSPQERAQLREQLRQQRPGGARAQP
ncbi:MAG: hypothetical protein WA174_05655 [Rhodoferax sp.]